jgi:hypothetical protein
VAARRAALIVAVAVVATLAGCTGSPAEDETVTGPQASISGEWVVTRTVVASDDTTNPARAVGANSVRYVLIEREDCDSAACPGTVSSSYRPTAGWSTSSAAHWTASTPRPVR